MRVLSKYRITKMIINSLQNTAHVRWVEIFSYCCTYRATIGEQYPLFNQIGGVPNLEGPGRILPSELRIILIRDEADGQPVTSTCALGSREDSTVLDRRAASGNAQIRNALKHSSVLEVVPERIVATVVHECVLGAVVPECVLKAVVPERVVVATVPERIPITIVPECVLKAVVPERIVVTIVPERVVVAIVPERVVVATVPERIA